LDDSKGEFLNAQTVDGQRILIDFASTYIRIAYDHWACTKAELD
jgi:hypothetical protein